MGKENDVLQQLWTLRLAEVSKALQGNGFGVNVFESRKEAADYFANTMLPELKPKSIGVGGSETVRLGGVYEIVQKTPGVEFFNPYVPGLSLEEGLEIRRKGLTAELYVTSTNALLREGSLLNLDGGGNRVAALCFGPRKVVLFVGRNKIVENMEAARRRIRELAAPGNNIRLKKENPCVKTGVCMNCKSPARICNTWVFTEKCAPAGRIHILLINEDVGY